MSCNYCKSSSLGCDPVAFYDDDIRLYIDRSKLFNIENLVDYHESHRKLRIHFCPICGESLKKPTAGGNLDDEEDYADEIDQN